MKKMFTVVYSKNNKASFMDENSKVYRNLSYPFHTEKEFKTNMYEAIEEEKKFKELKYVIPL